MRDIKFRAWDKFSNRFIDLGDFVVDPLNGAAIEIEYDEIGHEMGSIILEQYTGLKDKNGVEIYENDIIEIFDTSYGDSDKHYGVVKYSEYAELVVGNILLSRVYKSIKAIGNIHENADLLVDDIERMIPDDIGNDIHDFLHGGDK